MWHMGFFGTTQQPVLPFNYGGHVNLLYGAPDQHQQDSWSLPGAPGIRVSLARFSAFRTITLMRWASVWYCSRMNSWPKARGTHTELFLLWPNVSWELTLCRWEGEDRGELKWVRDLAKGRGVSFTQQMFPSSFGRRGMKWNRREKTHPCEYISIAQLVSKSTKALILSE